MSTTDVTFRKRAPRPLGPAKVVNQGDGESNPGPAEVVKKVETTARAEQQPSKNPEPKEQVPPVVNTNNGGDGDGNGGDGDGDGESKTVQRVRRTPEELMAGVKILTKDKTAIVNEISKALAITAKEKEMIDKYKLIADLSITDAAFEKTYETLNEAKNKVVKIRTTREAARKTYTGPLDELSKAIIGETKKVLEDQAVAEAELKRVLAKADADLDAKNKELINARILKLTSEGFVLSDKHWVKDLVSIESSSLAKLTEEEFNQHIEKSQEISKVVQEKDAIIQEQANQISELAQQMKAMQEQMAKLLNPTAGTAATPQESMPTATHNVGFSTVTKEAIPDSPEPVAEIPEARTAEQVVNQAVIAPVAPESPMPNFYTENGITNVTSDLINQCIEEYAKDGTVVGVNDILDTYEGMIGQNVFADRVIKLLETWKGNMPSFIEAINKMRPTIG